MTRTADIDVIQPNWVSVATIGSRFDEELDANARKGSAAQFRHRLRKHTGEPDDGWAQGRAPK